MQEGILGVLLVGSWTLFLMVIGVLWRVWRSAEKEFDKERSALYLMLQQEQKEKFEAALSTLSNVNTVVAELKTLITQFLK